MRLDIVGIFYGEFGLMLVDVDQDTDPEHYQNNCQSKIGKVK
jgi:hypothetical protein